MKYVFSFFFNVLCNYHQRAASLAKISQWKSFISKLSLNQRLIHIYEMYLDSHVFKLTPWSLLESRGKVVFPPHMTTEKLGWRHLKGKSIFLKSFPRPIRCTLGENRPHQPSFISIIFLCGEKRFPEDAGVALTRTPCQMDGKISMKM